MHLIIGLGNPEARYRKTRHNAGFMVVDRLVARHAPGAPLRARFHAGVVEARVGTARCVLIRPTTYMNRSGISVVEALGFYKADPATELVVITDDVALDPGAIRIRAAGGAGGHNGLGDIERALGSQGYPRLRVGIGASPTYMDQADYVLSRFSEAEWAVVDPALDRAADAVECMVAEGVVAAMNRFNERRSRNNNDRPPDDVDPGWLPNNDTGESTQQD